MQEFEKQMSLHNTLVIVATQVANEGSDMAIYQVGHDVKYDFDLLETYDMTLEAAFTKAVAQTIAATIINFFMFIFLFPVFSRKPSGVTTLGLLPRDTRRTV